jgi:hypothetical protein
METSTASMRPFPTRSTARIGVAGLSALVTLAGLAGCPDATPGIGTGGMSTTTSSTGASAGSTTSSSSSASSSSSGTGPTTCKPLGFAAPVTYAVGMLPDPGVAGDINGDGKPDLVVPNDGDDTVSVLINQGDGTFHKAVPYPVGGAADLRPARGSER